MKITSNRRLLSLLLISIIIFCSLSMTGCRDDNTELKDGYYTAEDKNGSHGWYEFITIYVNDGKIVSVEYNAKNDSGFIKSWDMNYMRIMNNTDGTYPNEYTRTYADQFFKNQSLSGIDAITGATHSYQSFMQLAEAVLDNAKSGDTNVAFVDVKIEE